MRSFSGFQPSNPLRAYDCLHSIWALEAVCRYFGVWSHCSGADIARLDLPCLPSEYWALFETPLCQVPESLRYVVLVHVAAVALVDVGGVIAVADV